MTEQPIRIVAIYGPTAVGKSSVAVEVARALDGEIVSADSMQIYAGIPIITDQPSVELQAEIPHHMVGFVPLNEEYSTGRFAERAAAVIREISSRGRLPILVGGTGLYIRALLGGMSFADVDEEARKKWELCVKENGPEMALARLRELDPEAAEFIDGENPRRIVRALEAAEAGGSVSIERGLLWTEESPYEVMPFDLELSREQLYGNIERRVDEMLAGGAIEEVKTALAGDISRTAAQAIGVQEIEAYLSGGVSLEDTASAIKQKSRNYAKRQLTWMRKMPDVARIDVAGRTASEAAREIIKHVQSANGTPSA